MIVEVKDSNRQGMDDQVVMSENYRKEYWHMLRMRSELYFGTPTMMGHHIISTLQITISPVDQEEFHRSYNEIEPNISGQRLLVSQSADLKIRQITLEPQDNLPRLMSFEFTSAYALYLKSLRKRVLRNRRRQLLALDSK